MVGGDLAAIYPLRMAAGILGRAEDIGGWIHSKAKHFPHGELEVDIVLRQIELGNSPVTSSCGRVLDAVAAVLGICFERTYEGEPAMKLESAAILGGDVLKLDPRIDGGCGGHDFSIGSGV